MEMVLIALNPMKSNLKNKGDLTMSNNGILEKLARLVRRFFLQEESVRGPNPVFKCDKTKDSWKLMRDVPFSKGFVPDIKEFLKSGEFNVNGAKMKKRAKKLNANLGQHHAEYLLEHQERIPKEWRGYYLIFPGTVWLGNRGGYCVPCLNWRNYRWNLGFGWLRAGWGGNARLVRSAGSFE